MTIKVKTFLTYVEEIAAEEPSYREGGYGADGTCDCIGLIVGAIRRAGGSWTGPPGSNYAARYEIDGLSKITNTGDLKVGEAILKAHDPGEEGYDEKIISSRYASSPDKRDYYHIGVVESVSPLRIRHMTTPKPLMDTKLGKWEYHGWIRKISKDGGDGQMYEKVIIQGGNAGHTINMRSGPGKNYKIIYDIPQGSEGELLETVGSGDWFRIDVNGRAGYVQKDFVKRQTSDGTPASVQSSVTSSNIIIPRVDLERVYDQIGDWLGLRG